MIAVFLGAVSLQIKASCLKVNGIVSRFSTHFLFKKNSTSLFEKLFLLTGWVKMFLYVSLTCL